MKEHHKLYHAFGLSRSFNELVTSTDHTAVLIKNENLDGYPLDIEFEELKQIIDDNCVSIKAKSTNVDTFISGHDSYDLTLYTNKSALDIKSDTPKMRTFSDDMLAGISAPAVTDLKKLEQVSAMLPTLDYATPLILETPYHYCLMLNDFLDASDYTLRNIHQQTGNPTTYTDEQIKQRVSSMLNQFPNLLGISYPMALQSEVSLLVSVKDWVLAHLNTDPLLDVADYIATNIDKVPLMRRVWSL